MPDVPPDELKTALANGRALIVCGAGVSRAATGGKAPGWTTLIEHGVEVAARCADSDDIEWVDYCRNLLKTGKIANWLTAADIIQAKLGGREDGNYRAFLKDKVGNLQATKPDILRAIEKLAAAKNRIATTNYDHLISKAMRCDRVDWTNHVAVVEALRGERQAVWHIHGDYDDSKSVIFSQADYERLEKEDLPQFIQKAAALNFTLVFVGCSGSGLSDDNVGELLEWLRKGFSGLGDKHFVLTDDKNADNWPRGLTVVRVGTHADLPAYLEKLAPPPRTRASFPPDPKMIGREDRLRELVAAVLTQDRPIVVPGPLGMGKTTLALAAAYDPEVVGYFGLDRRFFVSLEPVLQAEGIWRALVSALGLDASGPITALENAIVDFCLTRPALAILDNVETPWLKENVATELALARLAEVRGLHLIVTVRGEPPVVGGGGVILRDVESLSYNEAIRLFLRIAGRNHATDPALENLMLVLDGHPLSIELLAANAAGMANLSAIVSDWRDRRAAILERGDGETRLTSLHVSLVISLDALGATSAAHRLVRLMALLPSGMAASDCKTVLGGDKPTLVEKAAAARLGKARLASRWEDRWHLLAPVRETLLQVFPPETSDKARLMRLFLARAALGKEVGTANWESVRAAVEADAGNLDAVVGFAAIEPEPPEGLSTAAWGVMRLHRITGLTSALSIPLAAASFGKIGDKKSQADCVYCLGEIALDRSDFPVAREQFEAALSLYRELGNIRGRANCIIGFGDIAFARADHKSARAYYEQALPLYTEIGDSPGAASCIFGLGKILLERYDYDAADVQFTSAMEFYRKDASTAGVANCLSFLGDTEAIRSNLKSARARYEAALALYREVGAVTGVASCNWSLGEIALRNSDHDSARDFFTNAISLFRKVGNSLGEANCKAGLGEIAISRSDYDSARHLFEEAMSLFQRVGSVVGEAKSMRALGTIALRCQDLGGARTKFETALTLYRDVGDVGNEQGVAHCLMGLGDAALSCNNIDLARTQFEAARPICRKIGDVLGEAGSIRGLGDVEAAAGDIAAARRLWFEALAMYEGIPERYSIGFTHLRLARTALAYEEIGAHRETARRAWSSINRADLVAQFL